jgi:hypothetical protein
MESLRIFFYGPSRLEPKNRITGPCFLRTRDPIKIRRKAPLGPLLLLNPNPLEVIGAGGLIAVLVDVVFVLTMTSTLQL